MSDGTRRCLTFRVPMRHPGDTSAVTELIECGEVRADEIAAIFGKTEGNGCVNDFTRAYAVSALKSALAPALGCTPEAVGERIAMVMSGGTEGGLSPHFLVFARRDLASSTSVGARKTLAIGTAFTRPFRPEEIGRTAQIEATAEAVRTAMAQAAYVASREGYAVSPHIERRIYNGFPGPKDEARMMAFHDAPWSERLSIVERFEDERLRWFGLRLIYFEARSLLPPAARAEVERHLMDRLTGDGSGCLTFEQAMAETDRLLREASVSDGLLSQYRTYLHDRSARVATYRARLAA